MIQQRPILLDPADGCYSNALRRHLLRSGTPLFLLRTPLLQSGTPLGYLGIYLSQLGGPFRSWECFFFICGQIFCFQELVFRKKKSSFTCDYSSFVFGNAALVVANASFALAKPSFAVGTLLKHSGTPLSLFGRHQKESKGSNRSLKTYCMYFNCYNRQFSCLFLFIEWRHFFKK